MFKQLVLCGKLKTPATQYPRLSKTHYKDQTGLKLNIALIASAS